MLSPASELSRALASNVEAVCRRYLSNGRRHGAYWTAGDVLNTPGRSLYVRLTGPTSGKGAAGHWTDAATGQHGDLLDLIALNCGLSNLRDAMDEARLFLALPFPEPAPTGSRSPGHGRRQRRREGYSEPVGRSSARPRKPICAQGGSPGR